jgi:hypothetical protein
MDTERFSTAQGHPSSTPAGFEKTDARAGLIFGAFVMLFVLGLVMHWLVGGYFKHLQHKPLTTDQWRFGIRPARPDTGAFPKLQVSPPIDLENFRAREEAELHGYTWVNATAGVVHIPIERAMALVLKQGLPTRSGTNQDQAGPSSYELQQQRSSQRDGGKQ